MAIPVLKLNLVPEPSLWRRHHAAIGWSAMVLGGLVLLGSLGATLWRYHQASQAGAEAVSLSTEAKQGADRERSLTTQLSQIDVDLELPRWRLAERILQERATPWSRLAAEMEQSLVDGVRVKGVQRSRGSDNLVLLKLKAEARNQDTEAGFVESLRRNPVFSQVNLEREAQNAGGGWDFELNLPVVALLPPFEAKGIQRGPLPGSPTASKPPQAPPKAAVATAPLPKPLPVAPPAALQPAPHRETLQERPVAPAVRPTPLRPAPFRAAPGRRSPPPEETP